MCNEFVVMHSPIAQKKPKHWHNKKFTVYDLLLASVSVFPVTCQ